MKAKQLDIDKKKYKVIEQDNGNGNTTIRIIKRYGNCELCKVKEKKRKMFVLQDRRFVKTLVAKFYCNTCYNVMIEIINNVRTTYNQNKWYVGK